MCKGFFRRVESKDSEISERYNKLVELVFNKSKCLLFSILDEDYKKWIAIMQTDDSHSERVLFQNLCNLVAFIISEKRDSSKREIISSICGQILEVVKI